MKTKKIEEMKTKKDEEMKTDANVDPAVSGGGVNYEDVVWDLSLRRPEFLSWDLDNPLMEFIGSFVCRCTLPGVTRFGSDELSPAVLLATTEGLPLVFTPYKNELSFFRNLERGQGIIIRGTGIYETKHKIRIVAKVFGTLIGHDMTDGQLIEEDIGSIWEGAKEYSFADWIKI